VLSICMARTESTPAEIEDEELFHRAVSFGTWYCERPRHQPLALPTKIFLAIKDRVVYRKLAGERDLLANGQEIREAVTGETHSYASYWLRRPDVHDAFTDLIHAKLIRHTTRNQAPYGYGDDELYWPTAFGLKIMTLGKTSSRIKTGVENALIDSQQRKVLDKWILGN
jgi:hypothetical protein